jgi:hypothetical protein
MENNISQPIQSTTPEIQTPLTQPYLSTPSTPSRKTKYILFTTLILLILLFLGGGIYYLGIIKQQSISQRNKNLTTVTIAPSPQINKTTTAIITTQIPQTSTAPLSNNVYTLEDDGSVFLSDGSMDLQKVSKLFYLKYPDKYDFINVFTNYSVTSNNVHFTAQNHVKGIGSPLFDLDKNLYGNTQKLLGITYIGVNLDNAKSIPRATARIILEEMDHQWGVYLVDKENKLQIQDLLAPLHWSMGLQTPQYYGAMREARPWKDNGNGTFSLIIPIGNDDTIRKFHPFDLYLMGLISPSEIKDKYLLIHSSQIETPSRNDLLAGTPLSNTVTISGTAEKIGIDDIIRIAGEPRNPTSEQSQKKFNVAYVLLLKHGGKASQSDIDNLNFISDTFPSYWAEATDNRSTVE